MEHITQSRTGRLRTAIYVLILLFCVYSAEAYDSTTWRHYWQTNSWFEPYWDNGIPTNGSSAWVAPAPAVVVITNTGATCWQMDVEGQADSSYWRPELRILDGGRLDVGDVTMGYSDNMIGYILVSNGTLNVSPAIDSGACIWPGGNGTGVLEVVSGGTVTCKEMYMGRYPPKAKGVLQVAGAGSLCSISDNLHFGEYDNRTAGTCIVEVADNALVTVGDMFEIETTGHTIIITNGGEMRVNRLYFTRAPTLRGGGKLKFNEFTAVPASFDMDVDVEMGFTGMTRSAQFTLGTADGVTMKRSFHAGVEKGATIDCSGRLDVDGSMYVGIVGTNRVNLINGSNSVSGFLMLATENDVEAEYRNNGGSLEVRSHFYVGEQAYGAYSQSNNATALIGNKMYLGYLSGSKGVCTINGGEMTVSNHVYIGGYDGSSGATGALEIASGQFCAEQQIFVFPSGTMRMIGGSATCHDIDLRDDGSLVIEDATLTVDGVYTQSSGGALTVNFTNGSASILSPKILTGGTMYFDGSITVNIHSNSVTPGNEYPLFKYPAYAGAFEQTNITYSGPAHASANLVYEDDQTLLKVAYQEDDGSSPIHYVSAHGSATWPFDSWTKAAHTIQDAVDTAVAGDVVRVSNGVYNVGRNMASGHQCNSRVVVEKAITVLSVSGPEYSVIKGEPDTQTGGNGEQAVRCVYLGYNAQLIGFTLTNGYTRTDGDQNVERGGGGALLRSGSVVSNCLIYGNHCDGVGAGVDMHHGGSVYNSIIKWNESGTFAGGALVEQGLMVNCLIEANTATTDGGGVFIYQNGRVINCTIVGNNALDDGGGIVFYYGGTNVNSIIYNNAAGDDGTNWYVVSTGVMEYSCTTPSFSGIGNIADDPKFLDRKHGNYRLRPVSPCMNAGENSVAQGETELDGNPRIIKDTIDMGAYESGQGIWMTSQDETVYGYVTSLTTAGTNSVDIYNIMHWTNAFSGTGDWIFASASWAFEDLALPFGSNTLVIYGKTLAGVRSYDSVTIERSENYGPGTPVHYVSTNGANIYPYTNWQEAALSIQDAVSAADTWDDVLVSNGVYATGGKVVSGNDYTTRVVITRNISLVGVDGMSNTFIAGASDNGTNGPSAVRCVYASDGTVSGFTITNGYTQSEGDYTYRCGGGVFLSQDAAISNCIISDCSAQAYGGGILMDYGGLVTDCMIEDNFSADRGGGVCINGGLLDRCIIRNNYAGGTGGQDGGGVLLFYNGYVRNCLIVENEADDNGGGIYVPPDTSYVSLVENCTIVSNTAAFGGGIYAHGGTSRNCIVYFNRGTNTGEAGQNWQHANNSTSTFNNCCMVPAPIMPSTGCITNVPALLSAENGRLNSDSPCINAGTVSEWMYNGKDLDRIRRIISGIVDIGATEWAPPPSYHGLLESQTNALGESLEYALPDNCFYDATMAGLTYALILTNGTSAPDWLHIDPNTGRIYGSGNELGDYALQVRVTDVFERECSGDMDWHIWYRIFADAGAHGHVVPSGTVYVPPGGSTGFAIRADTYYHVEDVQTNGSSVGAVSNWTVTGIATNETLYAAFSADEAAHNTPCWWLASYGLTNGGQTFDQAANADPDGDKAASWAEYVADTDPTDKDSVLCVDALAAGGIYRLSWPGSSNRVYTVNWSTNLFDSWTNVLFSEYTPLETGIIIQIDTVHTVDWQVYYRIKVKIP